MRDDSEIVKPVLVRLHPQVRAKLEKVAAEQDRSMAYIMRKALEIYLQDK